MTIKLRVYEVARDLGMDNKSLVSLLQSVGVPDVRNHMSAIGPEVVDRVKRHLEKAKSPSTVEERIRPTVVKRRAAGGGTGARTEASSPVASAGPLETFAKKLRRLRIRASRRRRRRRPKPSRARLRLRLRLRPSRRPSSSRRLSRLRLRRLQRRLPLLRRRLHRLSSRSHLARADREVGAAPRGAASASAERCGCTAGDRPAASACSGAGCGGLSDASAGFDRHGCGPGSGSGSAVNAAQNGHRRLGRSPRRADAGAYRSTSASRRIQRQGWRWLRPATRRSRCSAWSRWPAG